MLDTFLSYWLALLYKVLSYSYLESTSLDDTQFLITCYRQAIQKEKVSPIHLPSANIDLNNSNFNFLISALKARDFSKKSLYWRLIKKYLYWRLVKKYLYWRFIKKYLEDLLRNIRNEELLRNLFPGN